MVNVADDDTLNIRSGPSSGNRTLGEVPPGGILYVVEPHGGGDAENAAWVQARSLRGVEGYVHRNYVEPR